jgi:hypothetical protein
MKINGEYDTYKHNMIISYNCIVAFASSRVINYAPRVMPKIVASLTIVIYDCNMFLVQATVPIGYY